MHSERTMRVTIRGLQFKNGFLHSLAQASWDCLPAGRGLRAWAAGTRHALEERRWVLASVWRRRPRRVQGRESGNFFYFIFRCRVHAWAALPLLLHVTLPASRTPSPLTTTLTATKSLRMSCGAPPILSTTTTPTTTATTAT